MDSLVDNLKQLSSELWDMGIATSISFEDNDHFNTPDTIVTLELHMPHSVDPVRCAYAALLGIKSYRARKEDIKSWTELQHENKISKILSHNRKEYNNNGS